jgi:hypothetical protein
MSDQENVKKIRELDGFDDLTPLSETDYLIVATNEDADGDGLKERLPFTKKATISQAVEVYNNSIAQPPAVDPGTGEPAAPDPEEQPGYEETDPATGKTVKRITTPVNGGNLDSFLDPDGGLTTVDFCQDESKAEVACDGSQGEVKYKTKKISSNGFSGFDVEFLHGFPKTKRVYRGGILSSVSHGIGKFLEHFAPARGGTNDTAKAINDEETDPPVSLPITAEDHSHNHTSNIVNRFFVGLTSNTSSNFGMIIWANDSGESNFSDDQSGAWYFSLKWGWQFINLPSLRYSDQFVENYWIYDSQNLGWYWLSMDIYPWIYFNSDLLGNGSSTGWGYANNATTNDTDGIIQTIGPVDLGTSIYFKDQGWYAKSSLNAPNPTVDTNAPLTDPGPQPTRSVTSISPELLANEPAR